MTLPGAEPHSLGWDGHPPRVFEGLPAGTWFLAFAGCFLVHLVAFAAVGGEPATYRWPALDLTLPAWAVNMERAAGKSGGWIAVLALSRPVARRLARNRPFGMWHALGSGSVLAICAGVYFELWACALFPRGDCLAGVEWWSFRITSFPSWFIVGTGLALGWHATERASHYKEAEIQADRLRREWSQAQIAALNVQLRPHFLFNTLQSIATLVHRDVAAADTMISGLQELFRRSASGTEVSEVTLQEELALVALYTEIESVRFHDRLRVVTRCTAAAARGKVPHLLLQPLVENSIHHAVAKAGVGTVEVAAWVEAGEWLTIEVRDSGPGPSAGEPRQSGGIGLANARSRLQALYGTEQQLAVSSNGGGTRVRITLPYVPASPEQGVGGPNCGGGCSSLRPARSTVGPTR